MMQYVLWVFVLGLLALPACASPAQPARAIDLPSSPAITAGVVDTSAPTMPSATATNLPPPPTATVTEATYEPGPDLPQPAVPNSSQALENVARIIYDGFIANQDLEPYIRGVMAAFGVLPLGDSDTDLATARLKQGRPFMFEPQVAEMADAFTEGDFLPLDSFIAAANAQGAKQTGTNNPLTREYLTSKFASYAGKANYEVRQVLPAFILALSKERAKQMPVAKLDPVWGDGLLDPLQVTLLLYAVSYSGPAKSPIPSAHSSRVTALNIYRNWGSVSLPTLGPASAPGRDPVGDFIKDQIRDAVVEDGLQELVEVPVDKLSAVQVTVCASILLYGHQMTVTTAPKEVYHKDGVKPSTTRIDVELSFEDDYWDNYLSVDRWLVQNLFDCNIPRRGPAEGKSLQWEVTGSLIKHGNFDVTPSQTDDKGRAFASWRTVPETTPETLRTFRSQRDAVGAVIVRAHGLVPGWSGLERSVSLLTDTGGVGSAQLRVIYYEAPPYKVDQSIADGRIRLTGNVCALDKPFTLNVKGVNAGLGTYIGYFKFTPANTSGGSWTHEATTTCLDEVGCGTVNASGTYQAEVLAEGRARIMMNPTTQFTSFGGSIEMPPWQFELDPGTGVCSSD